MLKPHDKILIYSSRKRMAVEKTIARIHMNDGECVVWTTDNMLKPHHLPPNGYVDIPN